MRLHRILTPLILAPLATSLAAQPYLSAGASAAAPLFSSTAPLEITLVADYATLDRDRTDDSPERPALLRVIHADGTVAEVPIEVRTRGNFRLRRTTCAFPNLRLDLDEESTLGGPFFLGQDKLKMVSHCRPDPAYEQNVVEEYLAYRLYNLVTDISFRVRLVRVTYEDALAAREPMTRYAFLIEDIEQLAARVGAIPVEAPLVHPGRLKPLESTKLDHFQFMIGNTDYSTAYFHNTELLQFPDGSLEIVPYDFDFAGIVDARYATPDPSLGTRSVRERVYRGFCRPEVDPDQVHDFFLERREEIEGLVRGESALDPRAADRAIAYLGEFFEILESPRLRQRLIERRCRDLP